MNRILQTFMWKDIICQESIFFVLNGIVVSKNCVEGSRNVCKGDGHLINVFDNGICLLVPSHLP